MFKLGRHYRRRELHQNYGGSWQSGISPSGIHSLIFLFTGASGHQYGYRDEWAEDGSFRYTGEGQAGDMQFVRGNAAIRDHAANGKELHLFATLEPGVVEYKGQMGCAGHELRSGVPDRHGTSRTAIVFRLVPLQQLTIDNVASELDDTDLDGRAEPGGMWHMPLAELRDIAQIPPAETLSPAEGRRTLYRRSEAVRVYVLRRANGVCEGCGQPAPFTTPDGRLYLEPHHIRRLSDGGPDHPAWVVALCPNCHRRAHHAADAIEFNNRLKVVVRSAEANA